MQFSKLSIDLVDTEWVEREEAPKQPRFTIRYDGPVDGIIDGFWPPHRLGYSPGDLDVFFRYQDSDSPVINSVVVSVCDRLTGDYLLEIKTSAKFIQKFAHAMRRYADSIDETISYSVEIWSGAGLRSVFEKETFLVYRPNGTLLRHQSVIPTGVEL